MMLKGVCGLMEEKYTLENYKIDFLRISFCGFFGFQGLGKP